MAATFSRVSEVKLGGPLRLHVTDMTCDTDYAAGGYAVTANNLGHGILEAVLTTTIQTPGYLAKYLDATGKVFIETVPNDAATGIDEASTGDNALDGEVVRIVSIGR